MLHIKRYYPQKKELQSYPKRYTKKIFDEYDKVIKNSNYMEKYNTIK